MANDMDFTPDEFHARTTESGTPLITPFGAPPPDEDAPAPRYGIRIGELNLLIPEGIITELLDEPAVYPLPRAPHWLAGTINMRGNVVPLFNLLELPGLKGSPSGTDRILVLGQSTQAVAIFIDGLPVPVNEANRAGGDRELTGILENFTEPAFSDGHSQWFEFNYRDFFRHLSTLKSGDAETSD